MLVLPPLVLAGLSIAALALLLAHRRANLGGVATAAFALTALVYGWVRSASIHEISRAAQVDAPYRVVRPVVQVAGVPLQELVGWVSAVALASYLADRLLRRWLRRSDPWSLSLAAGLVMAAICLTVESAAVPAGWWAWSLGHSTTGLLGFPAIALVDWGYVALDMLLPFELWRRRAPWFQRLLGTLFFPAHLLGHVLTKPLVPGLPLSGFDLVHVGLVAAAGALAWKSGEEGARGSWPASSKERLRWFPFAGGALIVGTTSAQLVALNAWGALWTGLPLAVALGVAASGGAPEIDRSASRRGRGVAMAVFLGLLTLGLLLRLPAALESRAFEAHLAQGVAAVQEGRLAAARDDLAAALSLRPQQADVLWLLGWVELQRGDRAAARERLEAAVALRPASVEAARYLALLDLLEGRPQEARGRLERRRGRYSEGADLAYLAWQAALRSDRERNAVDLPLEAPMVASADLAATREIFALARWLGDRSTMAACAERERELTASSTR